MAKVTFDGPNKLIIINNLITSIDVKIDLYSDWKEWVLLSDNIKYLPALRAVGGDQLPGDKALGSTFFLMNGWRIRPYEGNHTLNINGNLYTEEGVSPYITTIGAFNIMVISAVSSLVDSTVQQLAEIEYNAFDDGVTINTTTGVAGTEYPLGTQSHPVNNLADALLIAASRGFDKLYVKGNLTIASGQSVANYHVYGEGSTFNVTKTLITLTSGCVTTNSHWHECRITGVQGGESNYHNCIIDGLSNAHCLYDNCGFEKPTLGYTIQQSGTVSATHSSIFRSCYSDKDETIIDRNGTRLTMILTDYAGKTKFINQNRATESGDVYIHMLGGECVIDTSCTKGTFYVSGIGKLTNNGTATVVQTTLINASTGGGGGGITNVTEIADAVWSSNERELTRYQTVGVGNIVKDNSDKLVNTIKDLERLIKGLNKPEEKKDNREMDSINKMLVDIMSKIGTLNNNLNVSDLQDIKTSIDTLKKDYSSITGEIKKIDIPTMDYSFMDTIEEKICAINKDMESNMQVFKNSIERDLEGIIGTLGKINNEDVRSDLTTHTKSMDKIIGMVNTILETIDKEKKEKIEHRKNELEAIRNEVKKVSITYE